MIQTVESWAERLEGEKKIQWYFRVREEIIKRLGGECVQCGSKGAKGHHNKKYLEIDHPNGHRTYVISALTKSLRLRRWIEEFAAGKIRVLCRGCNGADNGR